MHESTVSILSRNQGLKPGVTQAANRLPTSIDVHAPKLHAEASASAHALRRISTPFLASQHPDSSCSFDIDTQHGTKPDQHCKQRS